MSSDIEVITGAELLARRERRLSGRKRPLVTSIAALDAVQGGGLRRGSLIELCGARSSGRFSIGLAALAAAGAGGEAAALIDCGDHLDPQAAASAGVALSRLLWLRPSRLKDALSCAEMALAAGFALIVLDLGERSARAAPAAAWLRLSRAAKAQNAVLLLLSPQPVAGTAADAMVRAGRGRALWDARRTRQTPLLAGLSVRLSVERNHGAGGFGSSVPFALPVREQA